MNNVKVFTPKEVITAMLGYLSDYGYCSYSPYILKKHVIDNSCGDGAILKEIVLEYVIAYYLNLPNRPLRTSGRCEVKFSEEEKKKLCEELSIYIHGIEIDPVLHKQCIENLNNLVAEFGLHDIKWDVICADALTCHKYDGMMDFVFANPPYQNVHDFGDKKDFYKSFKFVDKGMTDLYIIFFELGFRMLNENGQMTYITPSSWTTSLAGSKLREYIISNNLLYAVVDYKGERVFKDATTFTMITFFDNRRRKHTRHKHVHVFDYVEKKSDNRPIEDWVIDGKFYFTVDRDAFDLLKEVKTKNTKQHVKVKNGFATLNDKLFIVDSAYANKYTLSPDINSDMKWCIKASKNELKIIVYPYNLNGEPKTFDMLSENTQKYLLERAEELGVDTTKENWWLYGRTQAIKDMPHFRTFVNNLVKTPDDLKHGTLRPFEGVYSGYYIVSEDYNLSLPFCYLKDELVSYVKSLGKYKNGGYYTFSSKDLEDYLNYKIEESYETEDSSID